MKQRISYQSIFFILLFRRKVRNIPVYAILLFFINKGNAQSIAGVIQDERTAIALEGASVALFSADDSSLVTGTITKKDGGFIIDKLHYGNYYLLIKSIGYQPKKIADLNVKNTQAVNIGAIALLPAENTIQTVTVISATK